MLVPVDLVIVLVLFLVLSGIVILTVLIFVLERLDARKWKINARPGFPVDISPNHPARKIAVEKIPAVPREKTSGL